MNNQDSEYTLLKVGALVTPGQFELNKRRCSTCSVCGQTFFNPYHDLKACEDCKILTPDKVPTEVMKAAQPVLNKAYGETVPDGGIAIVQPVYDSQDMAEQGAGPKEIAADLLARLDTAMAARDMIAGPIQAQINQLQEELEAECEPYDEVIKLLEYQLKEAVLVYGSTVTGEHLQAVYSVRNKWDTKGLMGYAISDPRVKAFHSVTSSVSIKRRKK